MNLLSIDVSGWTLRSPARLPSIMWWDNKILLAGWLSLAASPLLWSIALLHLAIWAQWPFILWRSSRPRITLLHEAGLHVTGLGLGGSWLQTRVAPSYLVRNRVGVMHKIYQGRTLHVCDIQLPFHFRWLPCLVIMKVTGAHVHLLMLILGYWVIGRVICWILGGVHNLNRTCAVQKVLLLLEVKS